MTPNKQIVFFDGDCGFCNSTIEFVLRHEKQDQLYFTALQSDFTVDFLKDHCLPEPDFSTLYLWKNGKLHQKSTAALEISKFLKPPYSYLFIFKITPRLIRDFVYDFIAKHRKKIKNDACYLPSINQRKRFL